MVLKQAYRVVVLSFEGPDPYSLVGGLGVRVSELTQAFVAAGRQTQLIFIGDPHAAAHEKNEQGVELRRWAQWISADYPAGVYDGEPAKVLDYGRSVPPFLIDEVIVPAATRGEHVLVLAEDWQTAEAVIGLDRMLRARGLRKAATLLWNANNTYGFERINLHALSAAATMTAVSKYMKFELALSGISSLVIPNGIPARLLTGAEPVHVQALRHAVRSSPFFVKVGRYSPDKAWFQAVDALAYLRSAGVPARLIVRGGKEAYGEEVMDHARIQGLSVSEVRVASRDVTDICAAIASADGDIIDLRAFLAQPLLYALYASADAVLANSKKEPFGLVGLEVMASGGIAVCGSTGEEYAEPFVNAVVVDTDDGRELGTALQALVADPELANILRRNGPITAERFTWPAVISTLERKLPFMQFWQQGR